MADGGRVCDSEDSRWLVGLFLVKQREANSGPQICPGNLVFDAKTKKKSLFSEGSFSFSPFFANVGNEQRGWPSHFTSGRALQPQVGLTRNSACILDVLRRSGRRRDIKFSRGDFS